MSKPIFFKPYQKEALDLEYNRLFGDDLKLYRQSPEEFAGEAWQSLLTPRPKLEAIRRLAEQEDLPARLRILAFGYLLKKGQPAARQELLGFILEAGVDDGLDSLALYTDYSLVYISSQGVLQRWTNSLPANNPAMVKCFSAAAALAERLKPTDQPRFAPPFAGMARITLLLSDGRYFGQGPSNNLSKDNLSGPVIKQANQILARRLAEK
jgi:hypothetical protein